MSISPAIVDDLPALLEIQRAAFQKEADQYGDCSVPPLTQTLDDLRADLATKIFLKAVDVVGRPVGSIRANVQDGICHLEKLSVAPSRQRCGYGSRLLLAVENLYPKTTRFQLFTGHKSEANIRLYQRLGYNVTRSEEITPRLTLIHMEKNR